MATHIMLDLETMGTANNAAIVAIGACVMGPNCPDTGVFYRAITLESSAAAGLAIDAGTVNWWLKQSDAARAALTSAEAVPLAQALGSFSAWLSLVEPDPKQLRVWGNGPAFDNVILRSAYAAAKLPAPWLYWNDRCFRTAKALAGKDAKLERTGTHHNALDDAITQAKFIQQFVPQMLD